MARPIDADVLIEWLRIVPLENGMINPDVVVEFIRAMPDCSGWISVKDRLPENADHPGAFCPRYLAITKYGITEGWYNPDKGCWYVLVWFLIGRYTEDDVDMKRGDIPKISNKIDVTHWMLLPEQPKEEEHEGY